MDSYAIIQASGKQFWVEEKRFYDFNKLPLQPGDVPDTEADVSDLVEGVGYKPVVPVEVGVPRFIEWYREYYGV